MSVVVLMYHRLYEHEQDVHAIPPPERPYAIPVLRLVRHLQLLKNAGIPVLDPATLPSSPLPERGVVLTFDDGHVSHHRFALLHLCAQRRRAAFFVPTDFIGREGFCSARDVAELAGAGMTVGSHGASHGFLDDMDDGNARRELQHSRQRLQEMIDAPVVQMSFPGGRFTPATLAIGKEAGYCVFHTSIVGSHAPGDLAAQSIVRRVPIRYSMSDEKFLALSAAAPWSMGCARAAAAVKRRGCQLLGNALYHKLYEKCGA
jgi:peptidoglycan/xylan/chitin deacetylase (PgdA/CDA1 family)